MDPAHNFRPQLLVEAGLTGLTAQLMLIPVVIITNPDTCRVIRRHTNKPYVTVFGCSTGFTSSSHIGDLRRTRSSACTIDNIFHTVNEKPCVLLGDDLRLLRLVVQDYISLIVHNLGVHSRFDIVTLVGNTCISGCQFQIGYTVSDSTQSSCLTIVCIRTLQ